LQVILEDPDYREIQRAARSRRISLAQWVQEALALARRGEAAGSVGKKSEKSWMRCGGGHNINILATWAACWPKLNRDIPWARNPDSA
jgi:hypothetical protein